MTPEQLQAWQPQASIAQLNAFIEQHATLLQLLDEAWQKFDESYQIPPEPIEYAKDFDITNLTFDEPTVEEQQRFRHQFNHEDDEIHVDSPFLHELDAVLHNIEAQQHQSPEAPCPEHIDTEAASEPAPILCLDKVSLPDPAPMLPETAETTEAQTSTPTPAENADMPIFPSQPQATPIVQPSPNLPQLPNARQGEPYQAQLSLQLAQHIQDINFTPECGLHWHAEQHSIIGTPTQHGEIEALFLLLDKDNLTTPVRQILYINPDPKSLWQNIPSPPSTPFYKPDAACEENQTPEGTLLAARVRGRSHAHQGICCDDDFALQYHPATRAHLLAVSDGAGSASFSRLGSQLVVQTAIKTLNQLLSDPDKPFHKLPDITEPETLNDIVYHLFAQAVYDAYKAQYEAVQQHDIVPDLKSLSCTLLLALSVPLNNGQWLSAAYWVGDGAAALWQPEQNALCLLGSTDSGVYSGETRFLTAEEVHAEQLAQRISIKLSNLPPVLMLMTDGVSDPKFDTEANLAKPEYWQQLWQELQAPLDEADPAQALQTWLDFWSAGNHDDRTIALFIPHITETHHHTTHTETENT